MTAHRGRLLVVGFGNSLAADDGAGPAVVERLRAAGPVPGLRAEEGGSDALRLVSLWRGEAEVWLADAVVRGAAAGSIHRLDHGEVLGVPQRHASAHRLSLPECLRWLALCAPGMERVRYRLWGIEPARVALGEGLCPAVARAAAEVAGEIRRAWLAEQLPPRAPA